MGAQNVTYEDDKEKVMENDPINSWYRQAYCLLTFELSRMMFQEANKNESTMSIDLVIGGKQLGREHLEQA